MHDQQQSNRDLQTAFELLASVVAEMHAAGRRTYGASVKPALIARTNGGFNEHELGPGYRSFREFLEAAADAGVVTVHKAPVGPDVEILPLGAPSLGPRQRRVGRGARPRIRADIWKAFLDWGDGKLRVLDRKTDVAEIVDAEAAPLEPPQLTAKRSAIRTDADRYVSITPISREQQEQIMVDFVAGLEPSATRSVLELALKSDRPLSAFKSTVSIDHAAEQAFRAFRLQAVAKNIEEWKASNRLDLEIFDPQTLAESGGEAQLGDDVTAAADSARRLLHAAIDRMPLDQLNRLQIPVEFYIES